MESDKTVTRLRVLGWAELEQPGGDPDGSALLKQQKRLALLAYLAVERRPRYRRDVLAGMFWPDLDQHHARRALNQAIYVLRAALGSEVVKSTGTEEVGLADALWCDATAFQAAVQQEDFASAMRLYRGHLLESFYLAGAGRFQAWLEGTRQALRAQAGRTAATLARHAAEHQDHEAALTWCERVTSLVPTDEALLGGLADTLAGHGLPRVALAMLDRHRESLWREYELPQQPRLAKLRSELTPSRSRFASRPARSGAADDPLLAARFLLSRRDHQGLARAIALLEPAVTRVPRRHGLLTLLAQAYLLVPWYDQELTRDQVDRTGAVIQRALQEEPGAEGFASLALFEAWHRGDIRRAREAFSMAFDLDPACILAHHWFALVCATGRDFDSAIQAIDHALALDPTSSILQTDRATILFWAGRFAEAATGFETILAVDSAFAPALQRGWRVFAMAGQHDRASKALLAWLRSQTDGAQFEELASAAVGQGWAGVLGWVQSGRRPDTPLTWPGSPASVALAWATLGDPVLARETLASARRRRDPTLPLLLIDPVLERVGATG